MLFKQAIKTKFAYFFILIAASSCSENHTQNRAYVISQTQVETDAKEVNSQPE